MIGPSSTTETIPTSDSDRSSCGTKRKAFDDLDIDDFCNQVYPDSKKQYLSELSIPIEDLSTQIIQASDLSPADIASMTKLEVLVVDGIWDDGNFEQTDLVNLNCESLNTETTESEMPQSKVSETQTLQEANIWRAPDQLYKNGQSKSARVSSSVSLSPPVEDQENGNLSWLLDFKLDSFIDSPDDKCKTPVKNKTKLSRNNNSSYSSAKKLSSETLGCSQSCERPSSQKKPPFTYTELIEHALQEKGELTVSAIYQWISDHFPYYKSNDDRWKNSVRHNLSINPHFRKGSKAPHGAGHLWAIANQDESKTRHLLNGNNVISTTKQILKSLTNDEGIGDTENVESQTVLMDEVSAATASIIQQPEEDEEEEEEEEDTSAEVVSSFTLEHNAERILSGLKRDVEVQYLIPMTVSDNADNCQNVNSSQHCSNKDFLNPVSKEVVVEECGLVEESYLVTDLNPTVLGLNLTEPEVSPDNLFGEELSFHFYELTSPSQLQSA